MNSESMQTLCVILHYGSEEDTNNCLSSLAQEKDIEIIVADNDPRQSYEPPRGFERLVKVIKTGGVAGFSKGNNIAVNAFLSDIHHAVFILNNDTIVEDGAIDLLRDTLASSCVGAVGPCMPYASSLGKVWACGGNINRFTLTIGGMQPKGSFPYEVDYLPGAAILCRADLWKAIGGFNEAYFLAYEEAEFCLEIKKRGFKTMVAPRSIVLHKVGMSSQQNPEYFYNSIRNRLIFAKYIYGKTAGFVYGMIMTVHLVKGKSIKIVFLRIRLWIKAIYDDATELAVSREVFESISR